MLGGFYNPSYKQSPRCKWNFTRTHCRGNWITLLVAGLEECITNALRCRAEWRGRAWDGGEGVGAPCDPLPPTDTSWVWLGSLPGDWTTDLFLTLSSQCQAAAWRPGDTQAAQCKTSIWKCTNFISLNPMNRQHPIFSSYLLVGPCCPLFVCC